MEIGQVLMVSYGLLKNKKCIYEIHIPSQHEQFVFNYM